MSLPSWMELDKAREDDRKVRVLARIVGMKDSDVSDDLDREEGYQQLMEETGRTSR